MRAVGLDYSSRTLGERERRDPQPRRPGEVVFRVHQIGVCGTDRELAAFRLGYPPSGDTFLVLGHEALGQVIEGGGEAGLSPGDWVVPMIRRACDPPCPPCARGRRDLCTSGRYRERGIFGEDGYFSELACDAADDLVPVPATVREFAVLAEPLSVVEKAAARALDIHEPGAESALVLGAGPIGLLAALVLQARGLDVSLHSLEPEHHPRARLAGRAGIRYLARIDGKFDIIIEATGSGEAALAAIRALAPLGVCGILGASIGSGELSFRDLLVNNQAVFGSVNASPEAFRRGVEDLGRIGPEIFRALIRRASWREYARTIAAPPSEAVKTVLELG